MTRSGISLLPDARAGCPVRPASKLLPVPWHLDQSPCPFSRRSKVDVGSLMCVAGGRVPGEDRDIIQLQCMHQSWCPGCTSFDRPSGPPGWWPPCMLQLLHACPTLDWLSFQGPRLSPVATVLSASCLATMSQYERDRHYLDNSMEIIIPPTATILSLCDKMPLLTVSSRSGKRRPELRNVPVQ
jgi:hypothetical protein